MTDKIDKSYLKQVLEKQKEKAIDDLTSYKESAKPVELDQTRQGRLSRMDAMQQQSMLRASIQRIELDLKRIDATLIRLDSDEYGCCIRCGEEIEWERLKINPSVVVCKECFEEKR